MRFNGDREQGKEKESKKTTFTNVFKMPCYEGAHTHQNKGASKLRSFVRKDDNWPEPNAWPTMNYARKIDKWIMVLKGH